MSNKIAYRVNIPSVTHDTFDQEAVIINLKKGLYYSLDQTGEVIWQLIVQGCTREQIVQEILCRYSGLSEDIEKEVLELLAFVEQEEIVLPIDCGNPPCFKIEQSSKQPFIKPVLHKYSDLQDLLLLDPIHEVNEAGWPFYERPSEGADLVKGIEKGSSHPSTFFGQMEKGFDAAYSKNGLIEQWYQLAGCTFCLSFASPDLASKFSGALERIRIEPKIKASFQVCLWDTKTSGIFPPTYPWDLSDIQGKEEVPGFSTDAIKTFYSLDPGILHLMHFERKKAIYWVHDADTIPSWDCAAPLRIILNQFLSHHQCQLVHGAAAGDEKGAVLLVGKGGAGKSTTSLSCLHEGMKFLGDDYCLISYDQVPSVHSIYATAKLDPKGLAQFPLFQELKREKGVEKDTLYLLPKYQQQIPLESSLKAVLIPRIGLSESTQLHPAPVSTALMALAPSTLFQLAGTDLKGFEMLSQWLRKLPCYFLDLGPNPKEVSEVISNFLSGSE